MATKKLNIAAQVRALVERPITDLGYLLWDVSLYKEGSELILEVSVDKKNGMSIDDCSLITKIIEPLIDELDPIDEGYCLMVSSAGSERELHTAEQILFTIESGYDVTIKLFSAFEGKKEFNGIIKNFNNDNIILTSEGTETVLPRKLISKMTAHYKNEGSSDGTEITIEE